MHKNINLSNKNIYKIFPKHVIIKSQRQHQDQYQRRSDIMNEYLINVEETVLGTKIYIGSPDDTEYYLNVVNKHLTEGQIRQIVKQLVEITEGVFLREEGDLS